MRNRLFPSPCLCECSISSVMVLGIGICLLITLTCESGLADDGPAVNSSGSSNQRAVPLPFSSGNTTPISPLGDLLPFGMGKEIVPGVPNSGAFPVDFLPQGLTPLSGSEKLLVLQDGRVVDGTRIRPVPGGYSVDRANGSLMIPFDQVQCSAKDLEEAYRKLRDNIGAFTPEKRLGLARWCISYKLYHEAQDQLRAALKQDPERGDLRVMLLRVDEMLDPTTVSKSPPKTATNRSPDGAVNNDFVESLGGLSKENALLFTTRVQPILMNKCGIGNCHGAGNVSGFKLEQVRSGVPSHRSYSERNLAELMKFIDLKDPDRSPVLSKMQGTHGGNQGVIFHGSQGAEQLQFLRKWIRDATRDKNGGLEYVRGEPPVFQPVPTNRKETVATVQTDVKTNRGNGNEGGTGNGVNRANGLVGLGPLSTPTEPEGLVISAVHAEDEPAAEDLALGRRKVLQQLPDPFDPAKFNRQFHAEERLNRVLQANP